MKIRPVGAELFLVNKHKDRHDEASSRFSQLCERGYWWNATENQNNDLYVYVCVYVCMYAYVCVYVCVCMYVYVCMYVCVCLYACMCVYVYYVYVRARSCLCVCVGGIKGRI